MALNPSINRIASALANQQGRVNNLGSGIQLPGQKQQAQPGTVGLPAPAPQAAQQPVYQPRQAMMGTLGQPETASAPTPAPATGQWTPASDPRIANVDAFTQQFGNQFSARPMHSTEGLSGADLDAANAWNSRSTQSYNNRMQNTASRAYNSALRMQDRPGTHTGDDWHQRKAKLLSIFGLADTSTPRGPLPPQGSVTGLNTSARVMASPTAQPYTPPSYQAGSTPPPPPAAPIAGQPPAAPQYTPGQQDFLDQVQMIRDGIPPFLRPDYERGRGGFGSGQGYQR